ncbi:serine/threonine-protein kinase N2-like [Pelobates fuscus]|uniref:serine/threonine-protein kinase N2-like n=1 Tax=Pelobates fuscus TaxID=191477 RepID=UPI002FE48336
MGDSKTIYLSFPYVRCDDQKHLGDAHKKLQECNRKTEILQQKPLDKATPAISPLEQRIEELSHRFVIERAVAEGAKCAVKALHPGKGLVQAQAALHESNEKLDLLKYALEERVKELPRGHPRKCITTEELSLDSVQSQFGTRPQPTALTGTLELRLKGCLDILENVPSRLQDLSHVIPGRSPRRGRFSFMNKIRRNNLCAQLKIDHILKGSTSWKTVSNPSWDETFKLDLNKSRELELSLYWHDRRSLCATKTLRLEEFLVNQKQELCLQLEPQGILFIEVEFSFPLPQKRTKLQKLKKLFSIKKGNTIHPAAENIAVIDSLLLSVEDTESVKPSIPLPLAVADTDSLELSPPAVTSFTEEIIKPSPEEDTIIDPLPLAVADTDSLELSPPAVTSFTEEITKPSPEEDKIIDPLPLAVADTYSLELPPPAVPSFTEEIIKPSPEEDKIIDPLPLSVADTYSLELPPPAVTSFTEDIIQPSPEEDNIINSLSLSVVDTNSLELSLPAVTSFTEDIIQPSLEEVVIIDNAPLPVADPESVEQSPRADAAIIEEAIEPLPEDNDALSLTKEDSKNQEPSSPTRRGVCIISNIFFFKLVLFLCSIVQIADLTLQDFDCLSVLGQGRFGKVLLAKYKYTKSAFALKALKKKDVIADHAVHRLADEKYIMQIVSSIRHPFLVNLFASFQTPDYVCFVMEYAAGGDLLANIKKNNFCPFSENKAMFYVACCVLGLEFLHKANIAHRDIKLENIVIDKHGYAKITDFGLCKEGMGYRNRTRTFCGTLDYMAPEMVMRRSYTRSIDWWSLGVVTYMMLTSALPFPGDDRKEVMSQIVYTESYYPEFLSVEAVSIIRGLLNKNPRARLGSSKDDSMDLKLHPFFEDLNWYALLCKMIKPPYVPEIARLDDVSNFDRRYTSQAPILLPSEEPLTAEEQDLFQGFDWEVD